VKIQNSALVCGKNGVIFTLAIYIPEVYEARKNYQKYSGNSSNLQICRSNPAEANAEPSGWNLTQKISPPWPDRSIMGASILDVRGIPYNENQLSGEWIKDP
jgi:hypothetical protein